MAVKFTVVDAGTARSGSGRWVWYVTMGRPDGTVAQHFFPPETLEWRAAEYGLTDPAEILDVILHEPHLEPPARQPRLTSLRSSGNAGKNEAEAEPVTLFTAGSTREARETHLARIQAVKTNGVHIVWSEKDAALLGYLLTASTITPEGVRAKTEVVDTTRWEKKYGPLPPRPRPTPPLPGRLLTFDGGH